ncbi:39kDa virion core protein [Raccoonpox virus]|uniref:39kDa core protein OPG130 n=1 Tax=Raccoon poxvirus TaxID=10256 RepID=A0A0G3G2L5_RACVI|nr:39kDa core protein [Raccoonpox virus]AKJ93752.1 39kDa core protein [Raccoonpox virus]AOP31384.1 39kDa virion core protein [Raccoonpox virus]
MDLFNKFSRGLAESSTPKSSIYYSEEADTASNKKDVEVEIGLKNQESYYQRQLREQLARNNMIATNIPSMQPITPLQPTIHITPQPTATPTVVPLPKPRQVNTNTGSTTTSSSNAELIDWLSISNKMQNDNASSSSQSQPSTSSNTIQNILDKFNKDQKTTTPSSAQPSTALLPSTTTCTQQSDGSISCTMPTVQPPQQPPIVATVCTPTPTGGTVCTTAQQNQSGASDQQNLDNVPLSDLMKDVEKDMLQLQKESDDIVKDVNDAREYTRRMIDQILKLVKGLERFQK